MGSKLVDTTDGRTVGSAESDSYKRYGVDKRRNLPKDAAKYSIQTEYSRSTSEEFISSDESKQNTFVDKDSDEGGFRRSFSLGGVSGRRRVVSGRNNWVGAKGWTVAVGGIERGVYDVRKGKSVTTRGSPYKQQQNLSADYSTYERPMLPPKFPVYENTRRRTPYRQNWPSYRGEHSYYNTPMSPEFGRHYIPMSPPKPVLSPTGKTRSSSPGPMSPEWRQLAELARFNEISSVRLPSGADRSFPSTMLSSFPPSNQNTPSMHGYPRPYEFDKHSPYHQISPYSKQLSPPRVYRHNKKYHIYGSEIHEPPPHFRSRPVPYPPYYFTPPKYYQQWGSPPTEAYDSRASYGWYSPQQAALMSRHQYLGSGQHLHPHDHHHFIPPPYYPGGYYANVGSYDPRDSSYTPMGYYRRMSRILMKPQNLALPPARNQTPLATSSPPELMPRHRAYTTSDRPPSLAVARIGGKSTRPAILARDSDTPRSSKHNKRIRHHSAPSLTTSDLDKTDQSQEVSKDYSNTKKSRNASQASYASQDFSPNSSSGFGSKNTSQQQSSSQSGQSSFGLGLDSSRLSEMSPKARVPGGVWQRPPIPYDSEETHVPGLPPSYEQWLARQMQPQYRIPSVHFAYPVFSELPSVVPAPIYGNTTKADDVFVHTRATLTEVDDPGVDTVDADFNKTAIALDNSVDNHYEFDTLLSPTLLDDTVVSAKPEDKSVTDVASDDDGDQRRRSEGSMEDRVAAMKQEFQEYRRRRGGIPVIHRESGC